VHDPEDGGGDDKRPSHTGNTLFSSALTSCLHPSSSPRPICMYARHTSAN
jgi:hypothetical protein